MNVTIVRAMLLHMYVCYTDTFFFSFFAYFGWHDISLTADRGTSDGISISREHFIGEPEMKRVKLVHCAIDSCWGISIGKAVRRLLTRAPPPPHSWRLFAWRGQKLDVARGVVGVWSIFGNDIVKMQNLSRQLHTNYKFKKFQEENSRKKLGLHFLV